MNAALAERLSRLSTPHVTDGCLKARVPVRCAPAAVSMMLLGPGVTAATSEKRRNGAI